MIFVFHFLNDSVILVSWYYIYLYVFSRSPVTSLSFTEATTGGILCRKGFLKISQNSEENTCARVYFLVKLQLATLTQLFSWEFCKICKNTFFTEQIWVTASAFTCKSFVSVPTTFFITQKITISYLSDVFFWKGFLKIWSKFTGESPWRSAISIKLLCNFIEITLRHRCLL